MERRGLSERAGAGCGFLSIVIACAVHGDRFVWASQGRGCAGGVVCGGAEWDAVSVCGDDGRGGTGTRAVETRVRGVCAAVGGQGLVIELQGASEPRAESNVCTCRRR